MGTWGSGPFDNDDAIDWASDFDKLSADERIEALEDAFQSDFSDMDESNFAVAAGATLAALLSDDIEFENGPTTLKQVTLHLPDGLCAKATAALTTVKEGDSEWYQLWPGAEDLEDALDEVDKIIEVLQAVP